MPHFIEKKSFYRLCFSVKQESNNTLFKNGKCLIHNNCFVLVTMAPATFLFVTPILTLTQTGNSQYRSLNRGEISGLTPVLGLGVWLRQLFFMSREVSVLIERVFSRKGGKKGEAIQHPSSSPASNIMFSAKSLDSMKALSTCVKLGSELRDKV